MLIMCECGSLRGDFLKHHNFYSEKKKKKREREKKKFFQQRMFYLLVYTVYVCRWKFEEDQVKTREASEGGASDGEASEGDPATTMVIPPSHPFTPL